MDYRILGQTGIRVSRLCFGSLTIGPLQARLQEEEGAAVLGEAFDRGVNFVDTAELYKTYPYIKRAIKGKRHSVVISSKCYAYTEEGAKKSLLQALEALNTDYIDIFSLHEQESEHTIRGHEEALAYFIKAREKGLIRSIGISTHCIAAVKAAIKYNEIQVIHPIVNLKGLGIVDGSIDDMLSAVQSASLAGKGIYSMKPLGGGNLLHESSACFDFVLSKDYIHSIAVGMQSREEVLNNVLVFENSPVPEIIRQSVRNKDRRLHIDSWCSGCGSCIPKCGQHALRLENGSAKVIKEKCVLCGYCSAYCPDFCIKIV